MYAEGPVRATRLKATPLEERNWRWAESRAADFPSQWQGIRSWLLFFQPIRDSEMVAKAETEMAKQQQLAFISRTRCWRDLSDICQVRGISNFWQHISFPLFEFSTARHILLYAEIRYKSTDHVDTRLQVRFSICVGVCALELRIRVKGPTDRPIQDSGRIRLKKRIRMAHNCSLLSSI